MIWPFQRADTQPEQALTVLTPFFVNTLEGFDNSVAQAASARRLTECYVYGAIRYLVSYDEMKAGSTNKLFATALSQHFAASAGDIENCHNFIRNIRPGGNEQLFMIEGASALRRMLVEADNNSGRNLQALLKLHCATNP